jgi:hypothetical protein
MFPGTMHTRFHLQVRTLSSSAPICELISRFTDQFVCVRSSGGRLGRRGDGTRPLAPEERPPRGDHHPKVRNPGPEQRQELQGVHKFHKPGASFSVLNFYVR